MIRILLLSFAFASLAFSHGLRIFATEEGRNLHIKSYFSAKSPCKNCEVLLVLNDEVLKSGSTNENGEAVLELPKAAKFDIVVNAGLGHKGKMEYATEGGTASIDVESQTNSNSQMAESVAESRGQRAEGSVAESKLEAENTTLKFALGFLLIAVIFLSLYVIKKK